MGSDSSNASYEVDEQFALVRSAVDEIMALAGRDYPHNELDVLL